MIQKKRDSGKRIDDVPNRIGMSSVTGGNAFNWRVLAVVMLGMSVAVLSAWLGGVAKAKPVAASSPELTMSEGSVSAASVSDDDWLGILNEWRAIADLPAVVENPEFSEWNLAHARYMAENDYVGHTEDPSNPYYSERGSYAAGNSALVMARSSSPLITNRMLINSMVLAPFHGMGILDYQTQTTGYARYASETTNRTAAGLNIYSGLTGPANTVPYMFPANGKVLPEGRWGDSEIPSPTAGCPSAFKNADGYYGTPLWIRAANESHAEDDDWKNATVVLSDESGNKLVTCAFDKHNYQNPSSSDRDDGRQLLNAFDAMVIVPKEPLEEGESYGVRVKGCDATVEWRFAVGPAGTPVNQGVQIPANAEPDCTVPPKPNAKPVISAKSPVVTSNARPTINALIRDRDSELRRGNIVVKQDGKTVNRGTRYNAETDRLTFRPVKALRPGVHRVLISVTDSRGASASRTVTVRVR